jgi:hypothetical protein
MNWISENLVALIAVLISGLSAFFTWESNKRSRRREEIEEKVILKIDSKLVEHRPNIIKTDNSYMPGFGVLFQLKIYNLGFDKVYIDQFFLMESDDKKINKIHQFSLNIETDRSINSSKNIPLNFFIKREEFLKYFPDSRVKRLFIRIIDSKGNYFDGNVHEIGYK